VQQVEKAEASLSVGNVSIRQITATAEAAWAATSAAAAVVVDGAA